jgi:mannose-6-phosphate isomerase
VAGLNSQPYKLFNKIQNYEWGTINENAFIPKLLQFEAVKDLPYAELWIGAHPKAPSEIEVSGRRIPLNEVVNNYPIECLGEYVSKKFDGKFPFLLKVLSASRALSIQLHPNKMQAEILHTKDPKNYPDNNHKPEIAIAIDELTAIAGFKPVGKIILIVKALPELSEIVDDVILRSLFEAKTQIEKERVVKELYIAIMKSSNEKSKLDLCFSKMYNRIKTKSYLTDEETQFLIQYERYGNDIGLISFFFFNMINLKSDQAIFTNSGVPHAYLNGNIIECMANSDNVVRAGLTHKYKDVKTLTEIIRYEFDEYEIINSAATNDEVVYNTPALEFEVSVFSKSSGYNRTIDSNGKPSVFLIMKGMLEITWESDGKLHNQKFISGESFLIPASLKRIELSADVAVKYYVVSIL